MSTARERMQATRNRRRTTGLCPSCGKKPPVPDRKMCTECLAYNRQNQLDWWNLKRPAAHTVSTVKEIV